MIGKNHHLCFTSDLKEHKSGVWVIQIQYPSVSEGTRINILYHP